MCQAVNDWSSGITCGMHVVLICACHVYSVGERMFICNTLTKNVQMIQVFWDPILWLD